MIFKMMKWILIVIVTYLFQNRLPQEKLSSPISFPEVITPPIQVNDINENQIITESSTQGTIRVKNENYILNLE